MSWYQLGMNELELEPQEPGQILSLWFTCPRCEKRQELDLDVESILQGSAQVHCSNTKVCGEGNLMVELEVGMFVGSYKGLSDVPLKE